MSYITAQVTDFKRPSLAFSDPDETNFQIGFLPVENVITEALFSISKYQDKEVSEYSKLLLQSIQKEIAELTYIGLELKLPMLKASFMEEDNAIVLEWIFKKFRVGFSVEKNIEESSWHIISNKNNGDVNASGDLKINDSKLFRAIISFIYFWEEDVIS